MQRRGAFDYILLETTGLADPGNIAPLFWVDEGLGSTIYLDGIVTLVDAKNILRSLDEPTSDEATLPPSTTPYGQDNLPGHQSNVSAPTSAPSAETNHNGPHLSTAHLQISHADVIVLNKTDLLSSPSDLDKVIARIRSINGLATIHQTSYSQVPRLEGVLLDLHAYDSVSADELEFATKGHSHLDPSISTILLPVPTLTEKGLEKLDEWLRGVLWEASLPGEGAKEEGEVFSVHRLKGRLVLDSGEVKMVQGVRDVFEIFDHREREEKEEGGGDQTFREGKLVVIGRHLDKKGFERSLQHALSAV